MAIAATGALTLAALASPAAAIPSPELVVGSLTSLSQLAALLSAVLGGGAIAAGRRAGQGGAPVLGRIALLLGVVASGLLGLNVYQWNSFRSERQARLESTLLRPTPKNIDGKTLDPLLKEISYKDQLDHPLGISTDEAARIIGGVETGSGGPWMVLDIRENAEVEMGGFKNAIKVRFPDIPQSGIDFASRKALLICHNGNRSAETCAAPAAKGIDCRFIKGGLEKWLTEGRPIGNTGLRSIDELRAIADYSNHDVLLDTQAVHDLIEKEGAVFVDVRYPGEFAAGHLPGALNLPLRPTPSAEVQRNLSSLPSKPVIAPCYDRRSCFFAEILGLEITRAGHEFKGRYTVPWEYFIPGQRPPHVEAWLAESSKSWWTRAADRLQSWLEGLSARIGLPLAILVLALASRLLVLPFSLKAERDQIVSKRIEPEMTRLKSTIVDDPARLSRAIRQLYQSSGLTPARNLIALLFLPVLALSVESVTAAAKSTKTPLLWAPSMADTDALYIFPIAFSALLTFYVDWALVTTRRQRLLCWCLLAPLLFAAGTLLPVAANFYVIVSATLLLFQRVLVTGLPQRTAAALVKRYLGWRDGTLAKLGILSFADPAALRNAGNKAYRLAEMKSLGLPVPSGYVLTEKFLAAETALTERAHRRILSSIASRLGARSFAVRSSGAGEDGASASYAGVFESVLDVDASGLLAAVHQVRQSFAAARVGHYGIGAGGRNILIQPMIDAEFAGVVFTSDPSLPGAMLVEAVRGNGEALVSGRQSPMTFRFGCRSGQQMSGDRPPVEFAVLLDLARQAEHHFGRPQDIEWAWACGKFQILQSRDITTTATDPVHAE